jgi:hypothetical protein
MKRKLKAPTIMPQMILAGKAAANFVFNTRRKPEVSGLKQADLARSFPLLVPPRKPAFGSIDKSTSRGPVWVWRA